MEEEIDKPNNRTKRDLKSILVWRLKNRRTLLASLFITLNLIIITSVLLLNSKPHPKSDGAKAAEIEIEEDESLEYQSLDVYETEFNLAAVDSQQISNVNPTSVENAKPGSSNWSLKSGGYKSSSDSTNEIKGYANKVSINKGESIDFKVTVNPAQNFKMEIYRIGWYQGLGGRLMKSVGPITGVKQPVCPTNSFGMTECKWTSSYTLTIPNDWVSGSYIVKIMNSKGFSNYINFTLRDDARNSDLLFQNSVNTWQAYNMWGGKSLYTSPAASKVSFDRPYFKSGTRLTSWEIQMIRFLEKNGYDVTYSTNVDTHTNPEKLLNHKTFLSVGHDEYWTWEMRDSVEAAIDKGINVGFFGGNDSYWQVRLEKSSSGVSNRIIVGYKFNYKNDPFYSSSDPDKRKRTTGQFRYSVSNRPEQKMIGTMYGRNMGTHDKNLPWTVNHDEHWAYAGTGLKNGDKIPNVFGYEYNSLYSSYPKANNGNVTVLSKTESSTDAYSTIYKAASGAWVFSAGTTDWSWLLDNFNKYEFANPKIQKITLNILNKFVGKTNPTPTTVPSPTNTITPIPTLNP